MNKLLPTLFLVSFACRMLAQSGAPTTLLVDFGINTHETVSPDANGHWWNNRSTDNAQAPSGTLANLVTTSNTLSGVSVSVSGFGEGANANGTTVPDATALGSLGVASAARDSFFVSSGSGTVSLSGLAPDRYYRLECFGSRDTVDTRLTRYTATGLNTLSATLQTSGTGIGQTPEPNANRSGLALLENVRPTAAGAVTLSVTIESGSFAYLGALRITELDIVSGPNQAPEASTVILVGAPAEGRTVAVHYAYADSEGDPEGATLVEWQFDTPPFNSPAPLLSGTNRTTTLPAEAGSYVRAAVTPVAAAGTVTGSVVYSAWRGPIAASNALTVFHIGNSFTRWGHIPLQVRNLAADAGYTHVYGEQLTDGMGLGYHWTNGLAGGVWTRGTPARLELATGSWDWLVLQPMSREWQPAQINALIDHALLFSSLAASNDTRVLLYQYWNYEEEGHAIQAAINASFGNVRDALATNGYEALIIPAGESFSNAVATSATLSKADLYQDNLHPSDVGYYLSALVHYSVLYRQTPVGLTNGTVSAAFDNDNPVAIAPALAAELQAIAWDTVRYHPRSGVTSGRFEAWAETLPLGARGPLDRPFSDGVPNVARWAFGMPQENGAGLDRMPRFIFGDDTRLQYRFGTDAEDAGFRIREEWRESLLSGSWSATPPAGISRTREGDRVEWLLDGWPSMFCRFLYLFP